MSDVGNNGASNGTGGVTGKGFKPGQSGNPKGRPKGAEGFARRLRKATQQGADLVRWALEIASDSESKDRMRAIEFIADRMLGKAPQTIELSGPGGSPIQAAMENPLQGLTPDELVKLELIARRALARSGAGAAEGNRSSMAVDAAPVVQAGADAAAEEVPGADVP